MKLLSLCFCLGLLVARCTGRAAENLLEEEAGFNNTLGSGLSRRSLQKRDVWLDCENSEFRPLLQQALQDAIPIIGNMIDHLDLLLGLYDESGSGELKANKVTRPQRTFDENNAILSYNMIVSKTYFGAGNPQNRAGLQRIRSTKSTASALLSQFRAYAAGTITTNGQRDIAIYCDQAEYLSGRDHLGRTYFQSIGSINGVEGEWFVSQRDGINLEFAYDSVWVPRPKVCALTGATGETRFDGVPTDPGIKAHWFPHVEDKVTKEIIIVEESMTFCPLHFNAWIETERTYTQNRLHWRNMHVPIGSNPTSDQQQLARQLLALPEMSITNNIAGLKWLSNFVVPTLIHESTHSPSFLGPGVTRLNDIRCRIDGSEQFRTTDLACVLKVARGEQGDGIENQANGHLGHMDAEVFALYAMATWYNSVYWYSGYRPALRTA